MIRSPNGVTESLRLILFVENLSVVKSKVIRKISWSDFFSNGSHQLFVEHVFDVFYTRHVIFVCLIKV